MQEILFWGREMACVSRQKSDSNIQTDLADWCYNVFLTVLLNLAAGILQSLSLCVPRCLKQNAKANNHFKWNLRNPGKAKWESVHLSVNNLHAELFQTMQQDYIITPAPVTLIHHGISLQNPIWDGIVGEGGRDEQQRWHSGSQLGDEAVRRTPPTVCSSFFWPFWWSAGMKWVAAECERRLASRYGDAKMC